MRVKRALLVLACVAACNGLPLTQQDGGSDAASDVEAPDVAADAIGSTDASDAGAADATPDVVLRTANEWILPVDMDGDPQALVSDSQGNVIVAGQTNSGTMFFTKLDPYGNVLWDKVFAGGEDGTGLAVDSSDDVILVGLGYGASFNVGGATLGDGSFIAKFAADGTHVWSKSLVPTQFDFGPRVVLAANDSVIAVGRFQGSEAVAGGPTLSGGGPYAVDLASDGTLAWSKALGGSERPTAIAPDGAGGAVMVGSGAACGSNGSQFVAHVDGSGTCSGVAIADSFSPPVAVSVDPAGSSFVTIGTIPQSSSCVGDSAFMLTKLDSSLATVWTKCIQGGVYPQVESGGLLADDAGSVTVAGTASGAPDASVDFGGGPVTSVNAFLVRYAADGGYVSERLWPVTSANVLPWLLARAPSADLYVLGFTGGGLLTIGDASVLAPHAFLARVTP